MFRVILYIDGGSFAFYAGSLENCNKQLDRAVDTGFASGGHVEEHIENIGWVMYVEEHSEDFVE